MRKSNTTPSCVSFADDGVVVGHSALAHWAEFQSHKKIFELLSIHCIIRWIGLSKTQCKSGKWEEKTHSRRNFSFDSEKNEGRYRKPDRSRGEDVY